MLILHVNLANEIVLVQFPDEEENVSRADKQLRERVVSVSKIGMQLTAVSVLKLHGHGTDFEDG